MSRTTTAHLFYSADGVAESPDRWQFDAFGPEDGQRMGQALVGLTDVVIGRTLWQEWAEYWPGHDDPFGAFINPVRKHVVTSTLTGELDWNSTAIEGDPVDYVHRLREEGDGGITVVGGVETTRSLFLAGVVDTLTLTMHPVVAGEGRRLFEGAELTRLRLMDCVSTSTGNVVLTYGLRG